jgi:hypothetical protein
MNVKGVVDQVGRLIEDVHRQARNHLQGNSDIEEPASGELWERVCPDLERALTVFDRKELPDTPKFRWNPFRKTIGIITKKESPDTPEHS